ncbi:IMS domain-containing protein [Altericista sp. CCNU0014]|uniref:IMS domain-containing protein n=1 Tax=Altericista sp. CCNU0014 TaxID=3082949 RepID=UPI003850E44A
MQISLDFYRILGVPTRATPDQLQQAFEDRLQQMPRQEYSSAAIATRKQLLEEAFVVLADPQKREAYDKKWSEQEAASESETPPDLMLDISDAKLSGALLLLQEVGAYQQILDIGAAYLQRPIDLNKVPTRAGALEDDIILALALANLELGREQWQQSQFESAGDSLQKGLTLLEQEQRFPDVQAEIKGDLYKLRPYRILELLNNPESSAESRAEGLALLQSMLDDRDGIDGNQDDQSGLSVNDFLRFIQQLREYLTVEEQQTLFEREAARPSAVASYLAVYALIARSVSEGKPELVKRAKALLVQLGDRQDIAIEQGMCWLLLGQPEAAHQSVIASQDRESLSFMRQYSEGAPDLIPGLYLYTENWLQQEVYPYFRDLAGRSVSLQHYFNDPAIQSVLSSIESADIGSRPKTAASGAVSPPAAVPFPAKPSAPKYDTPLEPSYSAFAGDVELGSGSSSNRSPSSAQPKKGPRSSEARQQPTSTRNQSARRTASPRSRDDRVAVGKRRFGWPVWIVTFLLGLGCVAGALALGRLFGPRSVPSGAESPQPSAVASETGPNPTTSASPSSNPAGSSSASGLPSTAPTTPSSSGSPKPPSPSPVTNPDVLSKPEADRLVRSWQAAKAEAMGEQYAVASLQAVLAEPVLSEWKSRVDRNKAANGYWKYTLDQLEIQNVESLGKGRSAIKARVKETAQYYERGKLVAGQSYTDTYPVKYTAVQKDQQWRIQEMQVL